MYVCMYVCMYACASVYPYIHIHTYILQPSFKFKHFIR